jgi:hypothetical protein
MIKFFRHIRKSYLMENKTSKYFKYAIGEIVLVVIGILIALSLNNWNEQKKLSVQELILLKNLKLEMEENVVLLDDYIAKKEILENACDTLLSYTNPRYIEKKEDSLAFKLIQLFQIHNFKPDIMVLESAKSSNSLKLIRSQQVKTSLSKWEQNLKILMDEDDFGNQRFNNTLIPIVSNYYPMKNIFYDIGTSSIRSKHPSGLEEMFQSRLFENNIFAMGISHGRGAFQAEQLKILTLELVELLKHEIQNE